MSYPTEGDGRCGLRRAADARVGSSKSRSTTTAEMNPYVHYARPRLGSTPWRCGHCKTYNKVIKCRVFNLPEFQCRKCKTPFFTHNDLDFCLGDVKVNGISLIPDIMLQIGPNCFAYACSQAIRMNYIIDMAFKNKRPSASMVHMNPYKIVEQYEWKYRKYYKMPKLPTYHKILKVLDCFWSDGIRLDDGSVHKVGDITFTDGTNYNAICKMLANGEPLVACMLPGAGLDWLEYGEFYRSPESNWVEIQRCNDMHKKYPHSSHAVVLIGARTNHVTGAKGYWVVNSWPEWCKRNVISGGHGIVRFGIGLIREEDLITSAIKFWLPGKCSTIDDPTAFRPEPLDGTINLYNFRLFHGLNLNP